jgi:RHS repeat-associated protein
MTGLEGPDAARVRARFRVALRFSIGAAWLALIAPMVSCRNVSPGVSDAAPSTRDASVRDASVAVSTSALTQPVYTNSSNFNGTAISAGRTIWFTSIFKITGVGNQLTHVHMRAGHITFSANGTNYDVPTPDGHITIDPARTTAVTTFDSSTQSWTTSLPTTWSGNAYLTGLAWTVPVNLPGGINPVAWSASFDADRSGLAVKWAWSAAIYTTFGTSYNTLNVKPVDDNAISAYHNSDHAGTPEAFKTNVIGGARDGGGSNYTGGLSGTLDVAPSPCSPTGGTDLTCNGVDDDCDSLIDDDFVSSTTNCGQGVCARSGSTSCVSGVLHDSCTSGAATGTDNNCDAVDQDCDGLIDEAYAPGTSSCGIGACARTGTTSCVTGSVQSNCTPGTAAANDATCNAVDDDCNGIADEDYIALVTSCGVGACARMGSTSCVAGAVVDSCAPGTPAPNDATCNGIDDDCSGVVDEDYVSAATSCGTGACVRAGSTSCVAGAVQDSCTPGTAAASDATCDGIDDDCSGAADEDYVALTTQCGVGACAGTGTTSCSAATVHDSCASGTPEADDSCDLVDQDCDGEIDEGCESACTDTMDNDDDGDADCDDSDCHEVAECAIGRACTADSDCTALTAGATHGKCLFLFPGGYCTRDCVPEADPSTCPGGSFCSTATSTCVLNCDAHDDCADQRLECFDLESLSDPALLCRPTCETGTCHSGMYCDPTDNLCFACTATDTSCDRIDQDCDGTADDDVAPQPTSCGVGACVRTGARTCVNGQMHDSCTAGTGAASDASCDGVDDDCSGTADEDYVPTSTNCGVGACARAGVTTCVSGSVQSSCTPGSAAPTDATCDGIDDDCSGTADEDYIPALTSCGVGACARNGSSSCVAGIVRENCAPGTPSATDATCNGIDDDCSGAADEDYVPASTSCGSGACARTGLIICAAGAPLNTCVPGAAAANDATCDGLDDDCDQHVDENYAPGPMSCGIGACASTGSSSCVNGVVQSTCVPGTVGNDTTCNGIDEDCDGHIDEHYVPQSTSCGVGACAVTGTTSCIAGHAQAACTPGAPSPDTGCDGIDDDCDGHIDEAHVPAIDDANACTTDTCDPVTGAVSHTNLSVGASCSDGNVCNGEETCQGGSSDPICTNVSGPIVAWWPANGSATDIIGGNHGTPIGGVTYAGAEVGQGFNFDGVDDYVDVSAHAAALNFSGGATLEMWVRVSEDTCRTLFQLKQDATHYQMLQVGANCTAALSSELVTWTYANGGTPTVSGFLNSASRMSILIGATTLHHLALTFDGTSTRIYIDGVSRSVNSSGTARGIWGLPSATTALIGAQESGAAGSSFFGLIDEMTLFHRVLSDAEISNISAARAHGKCGSGTPTCIAPVGPFGNDGNPCTIDSCDPVTGFTHSPAPAGTACVDANACTQNDACNSLAACVGAPVNIDDANACTTDACNTATGAVTHQAVATDDGNDCTSDSCDPATGVHHTPLPGAACNDHIGCTTSDVCTNAGTCLGVPVDSSDGNPCTADLCNSGDGVTYELSHFPKFNGASCSDGNVCTDPDSCRTVSASCTSQPSGAVALWPADGYATDVIGAKHGVLGGGATYGTAGWNQSFVLNGSDAFVNVDASAPAMNVSAPATLEFWARISTDTCNTVYHMRQDATHEQKLQLGNGCTSSLNNELVTWTYVNGTVTSTVGYTTSVRPIGSFQHFALTFNGASTTIYVDGVQVATTVGSGTGQGKWAGFSSPLSATLGAVRTSGVGSAFFNGVIDDLAVYNRVLSASEIAAIKAAGPKCWLPLCDSGDPISNIDDGNTCTVDSCDPITGIHNAPAVGASCDDGNRCTAGDACTAQSLCSGHTADFCSNIGHTCTHDSDCGADAAGGICLTEAETGIPGGMCSLSCSGSLACPSTAKCHILDVPIVRAGVTINGGCFPKCTTNTDCSHSHSTCDDRNTCIVNCAVNADCAAGNYCAPPFCLHAQSHETNCADGLDEDVDGATDCADSECFGNPNCGENCTNNVNDDADGLADCLDSECPHQCEICYSEQPGYVPGVDDDHDGLADCRDPDCQAIGTLCQEGAPFHCSDNIDNDLDGKVDCADTDCSGYTDCHECPLCNGACSDGKDNDADGRVDCQDPDCSTLTACNEISELLCTDGFDNDGDGFIDCNDPGCSTDAIPACSEGGFRDLNCHDHLDNDGDGLIDCLDPSCACFERCDDHIDNDGNGATDCADLKSCLHNAACAENCTDGIDNNGVFGVDCRDPNCNGDPSCIEFECGDGLDNEHDGRLDCADPDCTDSPDCPETCDNGIDDDGNDRIDCADPECSDRASCHESLHCDDGLDNDGDHSSDCADSDCASAPACDEATHCRDGIDNDHDGQLDCADTNCAGGAPCIPEICGNMVDDDGDGMFDCADIDCVGFVACNDPPPPLNQVAPENNPGSPTGLFDSMAFVYSGPSPIQYFVAPETIVRERAALLRGQVRARGGAPMPGIEITILDHPEFGETKTDLDGMFTMVVNGGANLVVNYELNGFIPVQRQVHTTWGEYAFADDVVMTAYDPAVTPVDLSGSANIQVARGSVVTDASGSRQITIIVPPNIGAVMEFANGSTASMSTASIRATEFTFGSDGLDAMPAALPAGTAYTYAVEFTADEALAAGAEAVQFSAPVFAYLENFLGAPLGSAMPSAFYDRRQAAWVTTKNGRVIRVLQTTNGVATLDVLGDGTPSSQTELDTLGITQAELVEIATLYGAGQQLWRVPIDHFSPRDFNAPFGPPDDADGPPANGDDAMIAGNRKVPNNNGTKLNCEDTRAGSIIGCYSRGLGENVPIPGTPYSLHYESIKSQGPAPARSSFKVNLGASPSVSFSRLRVYLFGRKFETTFTYNQLADGYTFEFDGKDAAGREVFGSQEAQVELCNVYPSQRYGTLRDIENALGAVRGRLQGQGLSQQAGFSASVNPGPFPFCRYWKEVVSLSPGTNIGSWDIDVHQTYDPVLHQVYGGDGSRQGLGMYSGATSRVAGNGLACPSSASLRDCGISDGWSNGDRNLVIENPRDVAIGPNGALYVLDYGVTVLEPDGQSRHLIGRFPTTLGDDLSFFTPASRFQLGTTRKIELGPDGKMYAYMAKGPCASVYRFALDVGSVELVAGSADGSCGTLSSAEGVAAQNAKLGEPRGMKFAPDGALYLAEPNRVRRIGTDGIIRTVAGTNTVDASANPDHAAIAHYGEHGASPTAALQMAFGDKILDIAVHRNGELLVATESSVFAVGADGVIQAVAQGASHIANPDINDPFEATLSFDRIATDAFGGVLLLNRSVQPKVWMLHNGSVVQIAGGDADSLAYVEGRPASSALKEPQWIGVHPDGRVLVADSGHRRILSLSPRPLTSPTALKRGLIPSNDGQFIWQFDEQGRHEKTLDGLTRAVLNRFVYDDRGLLVGVLDADENLTSIERDSAGRPLRIVPPFAAPTVLTLDSVRRLKQLDGPGGHYGFDYKPGTRLLSSLTDPNSATSTFAYDDDDQRLSFDQDAAGGVQTLLRTDTPNGFSVRHTTSDTANPTTYSESQSVEGAVHREVQRPDGSLSSTDFTPDGAQTARLSDGTVITSQQGPDPRFGMNTPVTESSTITLPSHLQRTDTEKRTVTLQDPFDPFSIQQLRIEQRTGGDAAAITTYDTTTRELRVVSPEGREAMVTLDSEGRIAKTEMPNLEPTSIAYDAVGRVKAVTSGTGSEARRVTFGYRADGYLETVSGPRDGEQSVLTPDGAGRVTDAQRPDGQHLGMTYDGVGRLRTVTPPGKPQHSLQYTPIGLGADYFAPGLSSGSQLMIHADYNRDRKLELVTPADGRSLDYQYDPQKGRRARLQATTASFDYAYKASGQLQSISRSDMLGAHALTFDYDGALPITETWSGDAGLVSGSIELVYDDHFRVDKLKLNDAVVVDYGYDRDNLLTAAGPMTIARRPDNGIITGTMLGQMTTAQTLTTFGELDNFAANYASHVLYDETITDRDKLGRIAQRTDSIDEGGAMHARSYGYQYDHAARLTDVYMNGDQISHYEYDANGNRTALVSAAGHVVGRYDNQDRLTRYCPEDAGGNAQPTSGAPCFTYAYRTTGELLTRTDLLGGQTTQYDYDELGALRSVQLGDGRTIEYEIDAAGRRVGKYVDGVKQWGLLYQSGLAPIAQLDADNNVVSVFVYGTRGNVPDYMIRQGVVYRFVADHLGSVRMVVNTATGELVEQAEYDEFGNVLVDTAPGFQPFGFAGGLYDADTGLTRFGARDYDAVIGRWTAKDPLMFGGGDTNLYAYVKGDPINWIDPSGLVIEVWGSPEQRAVIESGLGDLWERSPTARKVIEALAASPDTFVINTINDGGNGYDSEGNICDVDPTKPYMRHGKRPWEWRPPAIGLAHELIHAYHDLTGTYSKPGMPEETATIGLGAHSGDPITENQIRQEWGQGVGRRPAY